MNGTNELEHALRSAGPAGERINNAEDIWRRAQPQLKKRSTRWVAPVGLAAAALLVVAVAPQVWRGVEKLTSPALDDVVSPAVSQAATPSMQNITLAPSQADRMNWNKLQWQSPEFNGVQGYPDLRKKIKLAPGEATYDGGNVSFTFYLDTSAVPDLSSEKAQDEIQQLIKSLSLRVVEGSEREILTAMGDDDGNMVPIALGWVGYEGEGRWVCRVNYDLQDQILEGSGTAILQVALLQHGVWFADATLTAPLDMSAGAAQVHRATLGISAPLVEKAILTQQGSTGTEEENSTYTNKEIALVGGSLTLDEVIVRPAKIFIPFRLDLGNRLTVNEVSAMDALQVNLRYEGSVTDLYGQIIFTGQESDAEGRRYQGGYVYIPITAMPTAKSATLSLWMEHDDEVNGKKLKLGKAVTVPSGGDTHFLMGESTLLAAIPFQLP